MKKNQLYAISYSYSRKSKEKAIEQLKKANIYKVFLIQKYFKNGYKTEKSFLNAYDNCFIFSNCKTQRFDKVLKKSYIFLKKCVNEKETKNVDINLNKYDINSYQDLKSYVFFLKTMFKL